MRRARAKRVRRAARGFALSETLVALAIGALILSVLLALHVNYIAMVRNLTTGIQDGRTSARLAARLDEDLCAQPASTFIATETGVALQTGLLSQPFLTLQPDPKRGDRPRLISASQGSIDLRDPVGMRVVTAWDATGQARPGRSAVIVETSRGVIATGAMRCDLPEICSSAPGNPCRVIEATSSSAPSSAP